MMTKNLLRGLNPHRVAMLACTLVLALVSPLNDGLTYVRDWRIVTSVVAPALMVIMVFVLLLDFTMTRVFAIDAPPAERADLHRASRLDLWALLVLVVAWTPFILNLLGFSVYQ